MIGKLIPFWVLPVLLLFAFGTVWLRLSMVKLTYSIHQTDGFLSNLKINKEKIELQLASLKSPRKLEALAKTKFNLSQPKSDQVIYPR